MSDSSVNIPAEHMQLRSQLENLLKESTPLVSHQQQAYDVVVTLCEVNSKHGTGILLDRIFGISPGIASIRSISYYGGEHSLGELQINLSAKSMTRFEVFSKVLKALEGKRVRRVICVPYRSEDLLIAIAVKDIFNVPLCAYIMDDQNIYASSIPDSLMAEFLSKASLRLAISPEMRNAYERKYNLKFFWLPPVVPNQFIQTVAQAPTQHYMRTQTGILIGNIWGQSWLKQLQHTIRGSGLKIDWYGHKTTARNTDPEELTAAGIIAHGFVPESQLVPVLRNYPYAIIATGNLDDADDAKAIAKLSLLSRIPFIMATSGTPMIVLGSPDTAVAHFVKRFQIGIHSSYDANEFVRAVEKITDPNCQQTMRENAARVAEQFGVWGIADWIWKTLETGNPADDRFETLAPRTSADAVNYIAPAAPREVPSNLALVYQALQRLQQQGFTPDFVIDAGASMGVWSETVRRLFPNARFVLVEPLWSQYDFYARKHLTDQNPDFEIVEKALSGNSGTTPFQVTADLYTSSLLHRDNVDHRRIDVDAVTLDELLEARSLAGKGLLKLDVQGAEASVLAGAKQLLSQIDALIVKLPLMQRQTGGKAFYEVLSMLHESGFRLCEGLEEWRDPAVGALLQQTYLFVRAPVGCSPEVR